jgi:hypothetical protein
MSVMNIDQRIRTILWPVTFFIFVNTLAINLFVFLNLTAVEGSYITSIFRISSFILSITLALKSYIYLSSLVLKEHESHTLRMHLAHSISMSRAISILIEDILIGIVQATFVFVSLLSFWIIVSFTEEKVTTPHAASLIRWIKT